MLTEKSVGNSNNFYPVNSYSVNKLKKFLRIFYLLDRLPNLSLVKLHLRLIFIACASHVTVAWAWRERCSWAVSSRFSGMRDLPWERGRFWTVKTSRTQNWETKDSFCSGDTWPDPNLSRSVGTGRRSDPWQQGWICLIPNCRFGSIQGFWETAHLPRRHYESDQKSGWWRQEGEEAIQGPSFLGFTEKKGRLNIFCQKYRNSCLYLRHPSFNKSCNLIFQKYCWGNGTKLSG